MSTYDLVIRNGEIFDGAGKPGFVGDIAIAGDRLRAVGKVDGVGREEIDAEGAIVTPGFIDVHTHYDGQASWETRMSPSSNHGVTTAVMGNCGVGFAPCRPHQREMLVELMEGVEDIPEVVMTAGLPWNWETFPEYLDALGVRRLDIDVAAQVPHSALRVYVMGARGAEREAPTSEDLAQMRRLTAEAIRAGAFGVTTSRNLLHRTRAGALAPSLHSEEAELLALAQGLRDAEAGVYQMIPDIVGDVRTEFGLMRRIAETAGRPLSFTLLQMPTGDPGAWRVALDLLDESNEAGVSIKAQVFPRPVGVLFGLDLSFHPFSLHPSYQKIANLSLAERVRALRDPGFKARLLAEKPEHTNPVFVKTVEAFRFGYEMSDPPNYQPEPSDMIERRAERMGVSVEELGYELILKDDGRNIIYLPGANYRDANLDAVGEMLAHPRTLLALGDGGAHYGMICDAAYTTYYLQNWVRDAAEDTRVPLSTAVRALTDTPARALGLCDRGRLAPGYKADINIIDLKALKLHRPSIAYDLPAGGRRLRQSADGYLATIKSGVVTYRDGAHTGALPGRLIRRFETAAHGPAAAAMA
jgi:N-acyl-D-aspartate/D-glutamate deacylase